MRLHEAGVGTNKMHSLLRHDTRSCRTRAVSAADVFALTATPLSPTASRPLPSPLHNPNPVLPSLQQPPLSAAAKG